MSEKGVHLLVIEATKESTAKAGLRVALQSSCRRLYLLFKGDVADAPDADLLTTIAHLFDIVAVEKPCLDVVPLLPFAGWTLERALKQQDLRKVFAPTEAIAELVRNHTSRLLIHKLDVLNNEEGNMQVPGGSKVEVIPPAAKLKFSKVAVGGTFDRLHAGHRSLLAATALVSTEFIFIGITGEKLLANKKHADLLESYKVREAAAIDYMKSVRPDLKILSGPLLDPYARTGAASDSSMEALVLSQETLVGGQAINKDRQSQGFEELALVVINLVGLGCKALAGQKLSSTALREREQEQARSQSSL